MNRDDRQAGRVDFDTVANALYRLDPEEFVPARTAAVAEARKAGDRPLATAIATLKKPTRSAWLVNLLVQQDADELTGLRSLAERVAQAHGNADLAALRAVGAERQKLVDALTRRAVAVAKEHGYTATEAVRLEVSGTLASAVADPDVLGQVLGGRVVKAQVYSGFGFPLGASPAPQGVSAGRQPTAAEDQGGSGDDERDDRTRELAQRAVAAATDRLIEARTALTGAEGAEREAGVALDRASQEVADLRAELRRAEQTEEDARRLVSQAADDLHDARAEVQQAEHALAEAARALGERGST